MYSSSVSQFFFQNLCFTAVVFCLRSIFEEGDVKKIRMGNLAIMGANKANNGRSLVDPTAIFGEKVGFEDCEFAKIFFCRFEKKVVLLNTSANNHRTSQGSSL